MTPVLIQIRSATVTLDRLTSCSHSKYLNHQILLNELICLKVLLQVAAVLDPTAQSWHEPKNQSFCVNIKACVSKIEALEERDILNLSLLLTGMGERTNEQEKTTLSQN